MCAKLSDLSVEYTVVEILLREAAARIEDALRLLDWAAFGAKAAATEAGGAAIGPTPSNGDIQADVMRRLMGAPDY